MHKLLKQELRNLRIYNENKIALQRIETAFKSLFCAPHAQRAIASKIEQYREQNELPELAGFHLDQDYVVETVLANTPVRFDG